MRPSSRPQSALGTAIRDLRRERGLTQKMLAEASATTTRTLSLIEHGQANPTWATVSDLADALNVSVSELASRAEGLAG